MRLPALEADIGFADEVSCQGAIVEPPRVVTDGTLFFKVACKRPRTLLKSTELGSLKASDIVINTMHAYHRDNDSYIVSDKTTQCSSLILSWQHLIDEIGSVFVCKRSSDMYYVVSDLVQAYDKQVSRTIAGLFAVSAYESSPSEDATFDVECKDEAHLGALNRLGDKGLVQCVGRTTTASSWRKTAARSLAFSVYFPPVSTE